MEFYWIMKENMALKREQKDKNIKKRKLQWHPAFYAGIQIEFEDEADKLTFCREYPLATKPILIDVLIIKKNTNDTLKKNIGRIFRKHNIVEYKSPRDYLSFKDFYKVYAYACHYIALSYGSEEVLVEEVTLTFVSFGYPRELIKYLIKAFGYEIRRQEEGIYYILGAIFPVQLIVTKELTPENNLWISSLSDELSGSTVVDKLSEEYQKHRSDELYKSVMNIVIRANDEEFREGRNMCEALIELFQDEIDEATEKGRSEGISQGVSQTVLMLLNRRGMVSTSLVERIEDETDFSVLQSWAMLASEVLSVEEFEEKMYM